MKLRRGNGSIQHNFPEVPDIDIDWVKQEKISSNLWEGVNAVKNCGHIHKKQCKNVVEVLNIPKKYIQRRQNQPNSQVEDHQTDHWVN